MPCNLPTCCERTSSDQLLGLINGYRVTQAIYVVTTLGIPDLLADGPRGSEALATETGTNRDALVRVLRALTGVNILVEERPDEYALTDLGRGLRSNVPQSRNGWAKFVARPPMWEAWGALLHTVRTGENAFEHVHGLNTWRFRAEHQEESAIFDVAMQENSRGLTETLIARVDFSRFAHIIDVGGGDGTLLAGILGKFPGATGTLFDLPHVATRAKAVLENAGLYGRANVVSGDFFDSVPGGGNLYLLKNVIHDWQDPDAIKILRSCRSAMVGGATLILVERIADRTSDADTLLSDLNMLVNAGGRERFLDEFSTLMSHSGFELARATRLQGTRHAIEAVPAKQP
jgi:O-methyltransferase domain/Dimerisation domain